MKRRTLATVIVLAACGGAPQHVQHDLANGDEGGAFTDRATFTPKSFVAKVTGSGRPVIFIPGLGCPGEMFDDTVARLGPGVEAHVLTLAGFAGQKPTKPPLAATVRRELVRYIRAHK